jgi:hypothetical protein
LSEAVLLLSIAYVLIVFLSSCAEKKTGKGFQDNNGSFEIKFLSQIWTHACDGILIYFPFRNHHKGKDKDVSV